MPTMWKTAVLALLAAAAMALISPIVNQTEAKIAPNCWEQPPAAPQTLPAESPIDITAAFALTRPRVNSPWEPIAWPMRHVEIIGMARRLGFTHEQTIAVESLHRRYLEQAAERRLAAIDSYFKIAPEALRLPNVQALPEDARKAINVRRGWLTTLAGLDAALFAEASGVLAEAQLAQIPREQARRERARFATDAWVAQWFGRGWGRDGHELPPRPPVYEFADVIAGLPLAADQRSVIEAAMLKGEERLTRQIKAVFDAACAAREHWSAITHRLFSPEYNQELARGLIGPAAEAMRLVMIEHEAVGAIASLLPADVGEALVRRHLRTVGMEGVHSSRFFDAMYQAALARTDLTLEERDKIAAARRAANDVAFTHWRREILQSRMQTLGIVNVGGAAHSIDEHLLPADIAALVGDRSGSAVGGLGQRSFDDLNSILGQARTSEINGVVIQASNDARRSRIDAGYRPESNFETPGVHFTPYWALPRPAATADLQVVIERLKIDEGSAAVIRALNDDRAAAWQATLKQAERDLSGLRSTDDPNDTALLAAKYARYRQALVDLNVSEAAFADALRVALEGLADEAVAWLTLGRAWSLIVSTPTSSPVPVEPYEASRRSSITPHWDRVHAVQTLLSLNAPLDRIKSGMAVLLERTDGVRAAAESCRTAVLAAIEAGDALNAQMQVSHDWMQAKPARQRQSQAALEGQRQRAAFNQEIRETHDAVTAALDIEFAEQYRRAAQRIAYPSAVQGIDEALALFDAALRLGDLDALQRDRVHAARADLQHDLLQAADAVAALIDEYASVEGNSPEAQARAAALYARLEHTMFLRDERCDAAIAKLRPILNASQAAVLTKRQQGGASRVSG